MMAAIALFGIVAYFGLPISDLPTVEYPTISVNASLPGGDPATMAASVASPLERQFTTIAGIDEMTSRSGTGNSSVTLTFDLNRNIDSAITDVQTAISAAIPLLPGAGPATAGICFSAFWAAAMSVNLYTMPLDLWGAGHAAFAVSMLTAAYGAMQALFSPAAGALIDRFGFPPVCVGVSFMPLLAYAVLRTTEQRELR